MLYDDGGGDDDDGGDGDDDGGDDDDDVGDADDAGGDDDDAGGDFDGYSELTGGGQEKSSLWNADDCRRCQLLKMIRIDVNFFLRNYALILNK